MGIEVNQGKIDYMCISRNDSSSSSQVDSYLFEKLALYLGINNKNDVH